jgi:hypothetical protein
MGYINHNLRKSIGRIGEYILGQTYVDSSYASRDIPVLYVTSGLSREEEYEIEAHELMHQMFKGASEYINRILTKTFLKELRVPTKYH